VRVENSGANNNST